MERVYVLQSVLTWTQYDARHAREHRHRALRLEHLIPLLLTHSRHHANCQLSLKRIIAAQVLNGSFPQWRFTGRGISWQTCVSTILQPRFRGVQNASECIPKDLQTTTFSPVRSVAHPSDSTHVSVVSHICMLDPQHVLCFLRNMC